MSLITLTDEDIEIALNKINNHEHIYFTVAGAALEELIESRKQIKELREIIREWLDYEEREEVWPGLYFCPYCSVELGDNEPHWPECVVMRSRTLLKE